LAQISLLPLAGESGRRPDEGGFIKNNAKNLRQNSTDAEKKLWLILRNNSTNFKD
jgi:Protein of unknown function (DUF559)